MTDKTYTVARKYTADASGWVRALKQVEQSSERTAKEVTKLNNHIAGAGAKLKAGLAGLASAFTGAAMFGGISALSDFADGMTEAAERMGLTTTQLQALTTKTAEYGATIEQTNKGLDVFVNALGDAQEGNVKTAESFSALGIAVRGLKPGDALDQVAKGLADIDNEVKRNTLGTALFGRAWKTIVPALTEGRDGLDGLTKSAEAQNRVISPENIRKLGSFGDQVGILGDKFRVLSATLGADFIDKLSRFVEAANTKLNEDPTKLLREGLDAIAKSVGLVGAALIGLKLGGKAFQALFAVIEEKAGAITALGRTAVAIGSVLGRLVIVPAIAVAVTSAINALVEEFGGWYVVIEKLTKLFKPLIGLLIDFGRVVGQVTDVVVGFSITTFGSDFVRGLNHWSDKLDLFGETVKRVFSDSSLADWGASLADTVAGWGDSLGTVLKGWATALDEATAGWTTELKTMITSWNQTLKDAGATLGDALVGQAQSWYNSISGFLGDLQKKLKEFGEQYSGTMSTSQVFASAARYGGNPPALPSPASPASPENPVNQTLATRTKADVSSNADQQKKLVERFEILKRENDAIETELKRHFEVIKELQLEAGKTEGPTSAETDKQFAAASEAVYAARERQAVLDKEILEIQKQLGAETKVSAEKQNVYADALNRTAKSVGDSLAVDREKAALTKQLSDNYSALLANLDPLTTAALAYRDAMLVVQSAETAGIATTQAAAENRAKLMEEFDTAKTRIAETEGGLANVKSSLEQMAGGWLDSAVEGTFKMRDAVKDLTKELIKMATKMAIMQGLKAVFPGYNFAPVGYAKGDRFGSGTNLAQGVYTSPTMFKFARGGRFGLMGEVGPEAVMPLARTSNGDLGVKMLNRAAEAPVVNVNVVNQASDQVDVQTRTTPKGDIEMVIARIIKDVSRGGNPTSRAFESAYALNRAR